MGTFHLPNRKYPVNIFFFNKNSISVPSFCISTVFQAHFPKFDFFFFSATFSNFESRIWIEQVDSRQYSLYGQKEIFKNEGKKWIYTNVRKIRSTLEESRRKKKRSEIGTIVLKGRIAVAQELMQNRLGKKTK